MAEHCDHLRQITSPRFVAVSCSSAHPGGQRCAGSHPYADVDKSTPTGVSPAEWLFPSGSTEPQTFTMTVGASTGRFVCTFALTRAVGVAQPGEMPFTVLAAEEEQSPDESSTGPTVGAPQSNTEPALPTAQPRDTPHERAAARRVRSLSGKAHDRSGWNARVATQSASV